MALVAYDNSDSSDYEDEDNESAPVVVLNNKTESKPPIPTSKSTLKLPEPIQKEAAIKTEDVSQEASGTTLFNLLPQPSRKKPAVVEEDDEFLHKKEESGVKPKVQISVPSLSDFKDVISTPAVKPKSSNGKKSGLLSMLPQPRNGVKAKTNSFIPNVLSKKPAAPQSIKKEPLPSPVKKMKVNPTPLINDYSDDSDDEVQNDFFSMNKPVEIPDVDMPLDPPVENVKLEVVDTNVHKPRGIESYFKKEEVNDVPIEPDYDSNSMTEQYEAGASYSNYPESNSNEVALDDEAIMKLCGARGKRKREDIQIVDVNQQEVLADARAMLLKGLMDDTSKRVSASKKKGNEPTSQQKRKHQITYLAYQAKANEAELQNQWANNRMSKRQTQAKYGF